MNKSVNKKVIGAVVLVCVIALGFFAYIYLDFSLNGLKFINYDSQRSDAIYLNFEEVTVEVKDGKLFTRSKDASYDNVTLSIKIDKVEETGTLLVCLEQSSSVYTPFKAEYFDVMKIVTGDDASRTVVDIQQAGKDKNGIELDLEPAGSIPSDEEELGKRIDTYYLRYKDGGYLKESDIDKSFPIQVTIEGYYETLTRNQL